MEIRRGIYYNLENNAYHKSKGLSKSDLDQLHRSAAHYYASKTCKEPPTPAMLFGSAFHCFVLEPERFQREYATAPNIDKRTKEGREAWVKLEASGKNIISAEDLKTIADMRESLMLNPVASELISKTEHEVSAYAEINNVLCKCRPDIWSKDLAVMADLKTTLDASPAAFMKAVANLRYYVQDAWYREVWERAGGGKAREFVFLAVEKKPPYGVGVYFLHPDAKKQGWAEALHDMNVYTTALENDEWTAYSENPVELELPRWAQNF